MGFKSSGRHWRSSLNFEQALANLTQDKFAPADAVLGLDAKTQPAAQRGGAKMLIEIGMEI